jgi:hypothetical protein
MDFHLLSKKTQKEVDEIIVRLKTKGEITPESIEEEIRISKINMPSNMLFEVIQNRLKALENNPPYTTIIDEVDALVIFNAGASSTYQFNLKGGKSFSLTAEQLLTRQKFDAAYMSVTRKIPLGDAKEYRIFLANLLSSDKVKKLEKDSEIDEHGEIRDVILRFIQNSTLVNDIKKTAFSNENIFVDGNLLYIPSQTIKAVLEREGVKAEMRRIRVVLDDVLASSSTPRRVGDKIMRFWVFDIKKLNELSITMTIVRSDEDEEEGSSNLAIAKKIIPQFIASDGKKYGPFQIGEIVSVPESELELLRKWGYV